MFSHRLFSPLRYPGGKARFAPVIAKVMQANGIAGGHYLEPYAGGAGVALDLLFGGMASHIHINDSDPALYAFWIAVTKHSRALLDLLDSTPITVDEWHRWRSVLLGLSGATVVERGFATLFLNRTNRSGILKAGAIGGRHQEGAYKLDARFRKDVIAERIREIAKRRHSISVYCEDALELLKRRDQVLPERALMYLDPPYYVKGKGLYRNYYNHLDHLAIAEYIQQPNFNWPWIVSYDHVENIRRMYVRSRSVTYRLNYTAQRHYVGSEVMFFSRDLIVNDLAVQELSIVS